MCTCQTRLASLASSTIQKLKDVALDNGGKQLHLILPGQNFLSPRIQGAECWHIIFTSQHNIPRIFHQFVHVTSMMQSPSLDYASLKSKHVVHQPEVWHVERLTFPNNSKKRGQELKMSTVQIKLNSIWDKQYEKIVKNLMTRYWGIAKGYSRHDYIFT